MNVPKFFLATILALTLCALPASASPDVAVNTPSNGATVPPQFTLNAAAATCSNQPVSAMGFSLDNSTNTTIVQNTSMIAAVTATTGAHTLHVKAWGNSGASCVTDIALTVSATANTVSVTTPGAGASVTTPFAVSADAQTCSSQPVSAMGYSLDYGATSFAYSTSMRTSAAASTGAHTLHVKAWGNAGAVCVSDIPITVTSSSPGNASSDVTVSSPVYAATVSSPFSLSAASSSCSSQPITAMGYSLDNDTNTAIVQNTSVAASVTATAGAHTLHVKAWGNAGAVCVRDVPVTVSQSSAATLIVNSSSIAFGAVSLNAPSTQPIVLTSTGTSPVTISGISVTGAGFTYSGGSVPLTLSPGQSATLYVMYNPTTLGSSTGQLTITSNSSSGSTATVALSGSGQSGSSAVNLSWLAPASSSEPVQGYVVLRASGGGSYQQINSSTVTQTSFVDSNVQSGTTYSYMVRSVGASGSTSSPSNAVNVAVP